MDKRGINRKNKFRTADFILNKLEIVSSIDFTKDKMGIPIMRPIKEIFIPKQLIRFSKAIYQNDHDIGVHFFEEDRAFARILHSPRKYMNKLKRFKIVIAPDFSQHSDMPPFIRFYNSWWNKALGAFWQNNGITVIPNVSWSTPDSYEYAFAGMPEKSIIVINSTAVKCTPLAKYLWHKGYEMAVEKLKPIKILRYGDKMPGEAEEISVYFENDNLIRLKHGR